MKALLLGEGPSDRVLVPMLRWLLCECTPAEVALGAVDTFLLPRCRTLAERVEALRRIEPADILFLHRDADAQPPEWRTAEIRAAAGGLVHVPVVPVRTTEAWLLFDESALRLAAGRPSGREDLELPPVHRLESVADPKSMLRDVLLRASGASGRRRHRFDPIEARDRVADLIQSWAPLRVLPAFQRLEADTLAALGALGHGRHGAGTDDAR